MRFQRPFFALSRLSLLLFLALGISGKVHANQDESESLAIAPPAEGTIRIATFNLALNRKSAGELSANLKKGDEQAKKLATIIQLVGPDILLANELDYDQGESAKLFLKDYLSTPSSIYPGAAKCSFHDYYVAPVNTGVDSELDLNLNGRLHDADDGWGYGAFPGQYGMAVYSRFPIDRESIRTFQEFRWSDMPNALRPKVVDKETGKESFFHSDEVWSKLRLSSKSHWDVPIKVKGQTLHVIASHPTPPVFDGPEDRNGRRNHDEIRLIRDYISGDAAGNYLADDLGQKGPLDPNAHFVVLGDLNSDPNDGGGLSAGIQELLNHKRVNSSFIPKSDGAVEAAKSQGKANDKHRGDPAYDTGDFNDNSAGNLRIDFVLPSANCKVVDGGVFWPKTAVLADVDSDLVNSSDHHLVWLDIKLAE